MEVSLKSRSIKSRSRSGRGCMFHCFRPDSFLDDDVSFDYATPSQEAENGDPLLGYIAVAEKQGVVLPKLLSSAWNSVKHVGSGDGGGGSGGGGGDEVSGFRARMKGRNGSFRHVFMAALNETALGRKIKRRRRRKKERLLAKSSTISNPEQQYYSDKISEQERRMRVQTYSCTSNSSRNSSLFTPTSISSTSKNSTSSWGTQASTSSLEQNGTLIRSSLPLNGTWELTTAKRKQEEIVVIGNSSMKKGFCSGFNNMTVWLFMTCSLTVLILCGKFCAILCTSIGLFVVSPHRKRRKCNGGCLCEETDLDSAEHKKKIIMEGMLDRRSSNSRS